MVFSSSESTSKDLFTLAYLFIILWWWWRSSSVMTSASESVHHSLEHVYLFILFIFLGERQFIDVGAFENS